MSSSPSSSSSSEPGAEPLGWLMDVPCPVDFVLGTATLTVADCARLAVDDVVRLAQPAGTDLELRVAGVPICTGEVLVVDQKVSLRLARVLPPVDQDVL